MRLECFFTMLHYECVNPTLDAPWVVFIHGAGGSTSTWNYQRKAFAKHYRLLLIDLRDHGESKEVDSRDRYSFELISSDILEVVDFLGIESAWFVSLSFGSVLLQDLAMRRQGLVSGATMAGAIFEADYWIKGFVNIARVFNAFLPYRWMYSTFSWLLMPRAHHQKSRRIYQRQARKLSQKEYVRWVGLYGEFFSLLRRFWNQSFHFPVQIIMGSEDYVFLPRARKFADQRKNVSLQIMGDAGHICNIDNPSDFNELGLLFIQRNLILSNIAGNPSAEPAPKYG